MARKIVRTICFDSHSKCGVLVHVEDGKIVRVEGDPNHPCSKGMVCSKGLSAAQIHDHPDRLKYPMRRKGGRRGNAAEWDQISWEEALDEIESKIRFYQKNYGAGSVITSQGTGRGWNHWHMRLNASLGVPGWGLVPTHVCLMPNLIPSWFTWGYMCFIDAADVTNANTIVEWGIGPFRAWPGLQAPHILDAIDRGAKLIVVDPSFEETACKAHIHLQLRPGTDAALALGLSNVIVNEGLYDKEFVEKWGVGFDKFKERVQEYPVERVSQITWVPKEKIIAAARLMATNRPTTSTVSLGNTMHTNGMQNGRAWSCLFAMLGDLDAKGGILSNEFWDLMLDEKISLASLGNTPFLLGQDKYPLLGGVAWNAQPHAVWEAIKTGKPWDVKGMIFVANEAPLSYENAKNVWDALNKLDFLVVKDYFMTPTARIADLVLPTAHWTERECADEELYPDPCPIVAPQKCVEPPGEAWCDWQFFLALGKRFNAEHWPWNNVREMWLWRLKTFYNLDLTWEEFVEKGYWITSGGENRVYKKFEKGLERKDGQNGFRTHTGKIEFYSEKWAEFGYDPLPGYEEPKESPISSPKLAEEFPLILTTGARVFPFYHSAWTQIPLQRELEPHPYVEVHPDTARECGVTDGEWVLVESLRGRIRVKAKVTKAMLPGVVLVPRVGWRDECKELGLPGHGYDGANPNILIAAEPADPSFGTPAMRSQLCRIIKEKSSDDKERR